MNPISGNYIGPLQQPNESKGLLFFSLNNKNKFNLSSIFKNNTPIDKQLPILPTINEEPVLLKGKRFSTPNHSSLSDSDLSSETDWSGGNKSEYSLSDDESEDGLSDESEISLNSGSNGALEQKHENSEKLKKLDLAHQQLTKRFNDPKRTTSERRLDLEDIENIQKNKHEIVSKKTTQIWATQPERARGKAKKVTEDLEKEDFVLISPLTEKKLGEIRSEVAIAQTIREKLEQMKIDPKKANLAIEFELAKEENWVNGMETFRMPKAKMDLEKMINKKPPGLPESLKIIFDIASGMSNLHEAGCVHGDLKPENVLLYRIKDGYTARLADFGKTREFKPHLRNYLAYSGNPRFCAPEIKLTPQSEVFSTALMMIRVVEGELLNESKDMLMQPEGTGEAADPKRRGVEKFLLLNKDCRQTELKGKKDALAFYGKQHVKNPSDRAEGQIHDYIDALTNALTEKYYEKPQDLSLIEFLGGLLKEMTQTNPENRPSMKDVVDRIWAPEVKNVQSFLTDKILKKQVEKTDILSGNPFLMPEQLLLDLPRSRYFLNGNNLSSLSFEKLKKDGKILARKIGLNNNIRDNEDVSIHAGMILQETFGRQAFLNISTIAQQGSAASFWENLLKNHQGYLFGSFKDQPQEYYIEDLDDQVKMSLIFYWRRSLPDSMDDVPDYAITKRELIISKEDLNQNWGEELNIFVCPSLQVSAHYSEFCGTIEKAKNEMIRKGLILNQDPACLDRFITEEDIAQEEIVKEQIAREDMLKQDEESRRAEESLRFEKIRTAEIPPKPDLFSLAMTSISNAIKGIFSSFLSLSNSFFTAISNVYQRIRVLWINKTIQ